MNYTHHIGIDASKSKSHFLIESADASLARKASFQADKKGFEGMIALIEELRIDPETTLVAIEATGLYHVPWCERLSAEGFPVLAVNPLVAKRHYSCDNAIRDLKSDPADARKLCDLARLSGTKLMRFRYSSQPDAFALKRMIAVYKAQRSAQTNLLKAAGGLAEFVFPELAQLNITLKSKGLRELLRRCPTPARIARLSLAQLKSYVGEQAPQILEKAKNSCSCETLARNCSTALQEILDSIAALQTQLDHAQQQIERLLPKSVSLEDQTLVRSIKGLGPKTVPHILAFLPKEILQQSGKKKAVSKIQAHFGFDPRIKESGKWKGKAKISKRGVAIARTALYQAAWTAVLNGDPELKPYYYELRKRKPHKQAVIDLMRKQLRRIVAVLKDRKPFEYRIANITT